MSIRPLSDNIVVKILVLPANAENEDKLTLFQKAFEGNPAFSYGDSGNNSITSSFNYVVFAPEVVQFFYDNLGDINGNYSTLYQEIAKDVFGEDEGLHFCTDRVR